jgi:hypothetical protein
MACGMPRSANTCLTCRHDWFQHPAFYIVGLLQVEWVNTADPGPQRESLAANNAKNARTNNNSLPSGTAAECNNDVPGNVEPVIECQTDHHLASFAFASFAFFAGEESLLAAIG